MSEATFRPARSVALLPGLSVLLVLGCSQRDPAPSASVQDLLDPWRVVTAPQGGTTELDRRIARRQQLVSGSADPVPHLERLGTLFVTKARLTFDDGFYRLAEQCAACIEQRQPDSAAALLLRGHVLHSLHRFDRAEAVARELVARRGGFLDHGLLGDVLLDRGRLREALASYQTMLDLKPCLQSFARAARVRWLRGDLHGARQLMRLATGAGSPRAPEALAWAYAQLASMELQAGQREAADEAVRAALHLVPDYAPALLARGRGELWAGDARRAVTSLHRAAERNPLPEYRWALAEALRAAGQDAEAERVEADLERSGAADDPRTFAVYLASRGVDAERAVELARRELAVRQDVYTHDAHAWALLAAGRAQAARAAIEGALAQGTRDGRLLYHAGAIAAAVGETDRARGLFEEAARLRCMLLPSEERDLGRRRAML